jgi:hypothetical protein
VFGGGPAYWLDPDLDPHLFATAEKMTERRDGE